MEELKISDFCAQCRHFHRHYVRAGAHRYIPLEQGHCSNPRCRDKQADTPACHRFSKRPPETSRSGTFSP